MAAKICNVCNIRRCYTGSKGSETAPHASEMCNYCFEEGGWENTHSDYAHEAIAQEIAAGNELSEAGKNELHEMAGCWICHPELNLAQKPKGKGTGPKTQGVRRPQFNHKGHSHPATPAARRACKNAFWQQSSVYAHATGELALKLAEEQAKWDHKCDGNGKPVAPKPVPTPKPRKRTGMKIAADFSEDVMLNATK